MPADFTGTTRPVYTVRSEPGQPVHLDWVSDGESSAKLSLALSDHASLAAPLSALEDGAILVLYMRWEEMQAIYSAIRRLADSTGLSLPTEGAGQS